MSANLLIITDGYPDAEKAECQFVYDLVGQTRQLFEHVYVISPQPFDPRPRAHVFKSYGYENVSVWYPRFFTIPTNLGRLLNGKLAYYAAQRIIKKNQLQFDLIHSQFVYVSGETGMYLKYKYKKPLIVHARGSDIHSLPTRSGRWKNKIIRVLKSADHVIAVSQDMESAVKKLVPDLEKPITVALSGFDPALFNDGAFALRAKKREELEVSPTTKLFIAIGRLHPVKQFDLLVTAFVAFKRMYHGDCRLLILGSGPEKKALQELIETYTAAHFIELLPSVRHTKIPEYIAAADVITITSKFEGGPVVLLEALAMGRPVVTTNVGIAADILKNPEHGTIIHEQRVESITAVLLAAAQKEWDTTEIKNYGQQFSEEKLSDATGAVYRQYAKIV